MGPKLPEILGFSSKLAQLLGMKRRTHSNTPRPHSPAQVYQIELFDSGSLLISQQKTATQFIDWWKF